MEIGICEFFGNVSRKLFFLKPGRIMVCLHDDLCKFMPPGILLRMRNFLDKFVEKIKHTFYIP